MIPASLGLAEPSGPLAHVARVGRHCFAEARAPTVRAMDPEASEVAPAASRPEPARGIERDDTGVIEEPWLGRIACADGLFVTDQHQRIVSWSSAAQRLLGYSPEEVVGQPCYRVLMGRELDGHPVCRRECQVTANARRGRGTAAYEVSAPSRDGVMKCLSASVVVREGSAGEFHVLHLLREVSARPVRPTHADPERPRPERRIELLEHLTRRELEVLRLFADGRTTDEIAAMLNISVFTARNHIASVQRKLGARSRLEVVLLGQRSGLI